MAVIFYLSAQPSVGPDLPNWTRVIAHFSQFAALAALWVWALGPKLGRNAYLVAAAISLLYAITDEYHQSFVAGRDSDPLDVLVDAAGIAFAVSLIASRDRRTADRGRAPPA